jgi:hypothetical protein
MACSERIRNEKIKNHTRSVFLHELTNGETGKKKFNSQARNKK